MTTHRDGLLPRMEARPHRDGKTTTYRYHPVGGKPLNLGTDLTAAIRKVLDMNGEAPHHGSMLWLWEQWQESKRCQKLAAGTRADYALAWKQIDAHMGKWPAAALTSNAVARYVHITRVGSPRRADIEKALISNLCKYGILLGVCSINPTIGVEPHGSAPSEVMPETAALRAFTGWLAASTPQRQIIGLMAEFASLVGARRTEFLDLAWTQIDEQAGVLRLRRAKQRGKVIYDVITLSTSLRAVLGRVRALNRDGLLLFPTRDGNQYTDRGWKTLWQRCVLDAIEEKVLRADQRFNFHALRRYYATMHRGEHGDLPDLHADKRVTSRVYDATRDVGRKAL
jgi:integrase